MISKEGVGVEISNDHLEIAYLKATPFNTRICGHAVYDLDATLRFDEKMGDVGGLLNGFLRRHRIRSACLWIGLPAEMVIQRVIYLPSAAKENLSKTLEYELPKYIPLASEDIYFRYQILDEDRDEKQLKILVAAVKKKDLGHLIELRNSLGAGIYGVESAATAGINGLKWAAESTAETACALAYAAGHTVHLNYFEDGQLRFMRAIDLNDDLTYQSERILRELGHPQTPGTEAGANPALIVYCHGPGATEDLLQKLSGMPNLEFRRLDLSNGPLKDNIPVAATGLALKSLQPVSVDINLFPLKFRKKPSVIGRYLTLALVLMTLITGAAWAGSHFMSQRIVERRVDRELKELSGEIKALGQSQTQIAALRERIDYLNNLRQEQIHPLQFLKELTQILPDTTWLRRLSVTDGTVEIEGYADYSTSLIAKLEASPLFANAKFISTITKGRDGKEVFKIGFEIDRQPKEPENK